MMTSKNMTRRQLQAMQDDRINRLYDSLDIIEQFEDGDNVKLKQAIREEIDKLENE